MLDLYGGCGQDEQLPRRPPLTQLPSEVSVPAQFAHTHESCPIASMWGAGSQTNDAFGWMQNLLLDLASNCDFLRP